MKKQTWFVISLIVLAFLLIGCKQKIDTPEERFRQYVDLWNKQEFENMYEFLSTESKQSVTKEEFVDRYTKIYSDLGVDPIQVTFETPEEETDEKAEQVRFPFRVEMTTIAGDIQFDHEAQWVKEQVDEEAEIWRLHWDTTFIFPELEEGDKVTIETVSPTRGAIIDRHGYPLAYNGVARQIGIVPKYIEGQEEQVIQQVADLLGMSPEDIEKALNQSWVKPDHFVPIKTIPKDATELRQKLGEIPGVQGMDVEARIYPLGEKAGHLTGNMAPVTAEDLEKHKGKGYKANDMIGRRGLELVLEDRLRGEPGVKIIIKKADGNEVVLAEKEVKDGENVQLTIDSFIQSLAFDELQGKPGSAAIINPITGETLALVSSPAYDPNVLTLGATRDDWAELQNNPDQPLLNRFNNTFAPGSVLKALTAAIGLKNGVITWDRELNIEGYEWQPNDSWGNYHVRRVSNPGVPIDLEKAMIYSDNIYFAQMAIEMGKEAFEEGLKQFGFEEEMPYLYPMNNSSFGNIDSDIALADSSYGQGQVEMNVLHLATAYTTFINDGNMIKPILEMTEGKGQIWKENLLDPSDAEKMVDALRKVVEDPRGTARGARISGYPLAGKTGTAEFGKVEQGTKGNAHGWFVAFNPEDPQYLIALMYENESSGETVNTVKRLFEEIVSAYNFEETE